MAWFEFFWSPEIEEHVAANNVTIGEFEEVVSNAKEVQRSRSSGDPLVTGYTSEGRFLICVFRYIDDFTIEPVTAFEPTPRD
ncbi:MAG: hypothetical protein C0478_09815 [Planctomyces sp.]|nr:hypothetical protein [Planctomyces sp.]